MERERIPNGTLEKLRPHFPVEVSDVREAEGAQSIAAAEKALAVNFFLQPRLGRKVLSPAEEAGMGLLARGIGWPEVEKKSATGA